MLCFNACGAVTPHIKLNGQPVSVVHKDKHLGNYISDSIHDHHILNNICDLYQRSNLLISQFRSCDSETLDILHKTYCMHMYGCELWNLSCCYINGYKVAWRKIKRRIWNISPRTHNNLVFNVTDNIDTLIETRMVRFIFNSINHSNNTCKNILRVKLLSVNSTFAANYQYLSYKYGLIEADWFTPLGHLLGKVKKKMLLLHPHPVLWKDSSLTSTSKHVAVNAVYICADIWILIGIPYLNISPVRDIHLLVTLIYRRRLGTAYL